MWGEGHHLAASQELKIQNQLQLRLQQVSNKGLACIRVILLETLVCRHFNPGKGHCKNDSLPKKIYCSEHL